MSEESSKGGRYDDKFMWEAMTKEMKRLMDRIESIGEEVRENKKNASDLKTNARRGRFFEQEDFEEDDRQSEGGRK